MNRPLIAILASGFSDSERIYRVGMGYMQWVRRAGGIACMIHHDSDPEYMAAVARRADGVLFTGGPDLGPHYFGELPIPESGTIEPQRDSAEKALFDAFYPTGKPMLGICKGMQVLNAFMGGSLYQDIGAQYPGQAIGHRQGCAGNIATHPITVERDSPLFALAGGERVRVNTFHHQAVKALAPGMAAMAAADDGIIEAIWAPQHPLLWGTQFHPELFDPGFELSEGLFAAFIDGCK